MSAFLNKIANLYTRILTDSVVGEQALDYMISRGFTVDTIKDFGVGFSPDRTIDYIGKEYLTYTDVDYLVEAQHLFENTLRGKTVYRDRFAGRITFPVKDGNGIVEGFAARAMGEELPKYLNSAESDWYHKSEALFGFDLAATSIFDSNKAIICEGYTDAMAFHQTGTKFAVACGGTYATKYQIAKIARYTNNIYLAFDSDSAGDEVTDRTHALVKEMGLNVGRITAIPRGQDPAEFLLRDTATIK